MAELGLRPVLVWLHNALNTSIRLPFICLVIEQQSFLRISIFKLPSGSDSMFLLLSDSKNFLFFFFTFLSPPILPAQHTLSKLDCSCLLEKSFAHSLPLANYFILLVLVDLTQNTDLTNRKFACHYNQNINDTLVNKYELKM